jgi:hypothetical protein
MRRITGVYVIPDTVSEKALPLPEEIMVMGYGMDSCLRDDLGKGHGKGYVKGDSKRVLRYDKINVEIPDKIIESFLEPKPMVMDSFGECRGPLLMIECVFVDAAYFRMLEVQFLRLHGKIRRGVQFSRKIKTTACIAFEGFRPFFCLEGNTVRTGNSKRNEAYVFFHIALIV